MENVLPIFESGGIDLRGQVWVCGGLVYMKWVAIFLVFAGGKVQKTSIYRSPSGSHLDFFWTFGLF